MKPNKNVIIVLNSIIFVVVCLNFIQLHFENNDIPYWVFWAVCIIFGLLIVFVTNSQLNGKGKYKTSNANRKKKKRDKG